MSKKMPPDLAHRSGGILLGVYRLGLSGHGFATQAVSLRVAA
ncbi:MAG: hypothetical protein VB143_00730 [Burkholderia sp.]